MWSPFRRAEGQKGGDDPGEIHDGYDFFFFFIKSGTARGEHPCF